MHNSSKFIKLWLIRANLVIFILIFAFNMLVNEAGASWDIRDIMDGGLVITGSDSLLAINMPLAPKTMEVILTAYSSTPDQTDDTPFITASNTYVRDGIVAANFLAFGTQVKIPALFGDKVFTVEDRMARKNNDKIDIWFPERHLAKNFGVQRASVVILE